MRLIKTIKIVFLQIPPNNIIGVVVAEQLHMSATSSLHHHRYMKNTRVTPNFRTR
jgi:hypothetical protein